MAENQVTILAQSNHGYVKQCQCCQKVGIGYKNIYIPLKKSDFTTFKDYVQDLFNEKGLGQSGRTEGCVHLAFADVVVRLSNEEFRQFHDMIEAAELELFRQQLEVTFQTA